MAIISDEDYPPPSSRSFIDISVATYHGVILKKDSLVFYIDYKTPGEAELRTSSCELLTKLELFQGGFRLCAGLDSTTGLSINDVFIFLSQILLHLLGKNVFRYLVRATNANAKASPVTVNMPMKTTKEHPNGGNGHCSMI